MGRREVEDVMEREEERKRKKRENDRKIEKKREEEEEMREIERVNVRYAGGKGRRRKGSES